jgi:hypothetical protein
MPEPIQLAVNYSNESEGLLRSGKIAFHLFKLPDWPDLVDRLGKAYPAYIHFTLAVGVGELELADWPLILRLLDLTHTPRVNVHLISPPTLDYRDPRQVEALIQSVISELRFIGAKMGMDRVILENAPIAESGEDYLLPVVAPEVIARIVRETGCGFLLDLAHARLVCRMLGVDERAYLSILPVERLQELHITGVGFHEARWVDHLPMQPEDWALLGWSLEQIRCGKWARPKIAAFEYGGFGDIFSWRSDVNILKTQVPQLSHCLSGF